MKSLFAAIFLLISFTLFSQIDSVPYSREYEFKEGIYLTIEQFKKNTPIAKSAVVSDIPKSQLDFLTQVMDHKKIILKDSAGNDQKIETASVWGYCQNRTIYINFNNEFNRVNVIGTLCHLTAIITRVTTFDDPINSTYGMNTTFDELRQFILDIQTNKILSFDVKNMEILLARDNELYKQFMALKRREKSDSIFIYLRKYNEKHPLYLPSKQ
ncbi:MAG: hypothetical protein ACT4ON_11900 [Bacteroidota bacterium]